MNLLDAVDNLVTSLKILADHNPRNMLVIVEELIATTHATMQNIPPFLTEEEELVWTDTRHNLRVNQREIRISIRRLERHCPHMNGSREIDIHALPIAHSIAHEIRERIANATLN